MADKRHQVFVSSTYEDLQAERQAVMHALLELECIPSGMELFPAANEDQWTLIKDVIKDCDYYLLIVGGRYGSIGPSGLSYTEMEYRYAIELGKPIIAFLHKEPDSLPKKRTEASETGQGKLKEFRDLCQKRLCKFWTNPEELGSVVSRGLIMLQRKHPGIGWVRGNALASEAAAKQILELKEQIERLNKELDVSSLQAPPGTEKLAKGDETYSFLVEFKATSALNIRVISNVWVDESWDDVFSEISPLMIDEAAEHELKSALDGFFKVAAKREIKKIDKYNGWTNLADFSLRNDDFQTIKIQLRSLGLITKSDRIRSVKSAGTYWSLTPYGDNVMVRLRAIETERNENPSGENPA